MSNVKLVEKSDATAVAQHAALIVKQYIQHSPDGSIIFPTGKTPKALYEILKNDKSIQWSDLHLFHLDDYVPPKDAGATKPYISFKEEIDASLWDAIGGKKHYVLDDIHNPLHYEERIIATHGPGLVILGIGQNGHIAFNEPPCPQDSQTREVPLCPTTLKANFGLDTPQADYPNSAITLGIDLILKAHEILLLATGEHKRDIIERAFNPDTEPDENCPASWLKLHRNTTVLCDFFLQIPD